MPTARPLFALLIGLGLIAPARAADPPLPDDLKLVPGDAAVVACVRGAELYKTQFFQRVHKELLTNEMRKEIAAAAETPGLIGPFMRQFVPGDAGLADVISLNSIERLTTYVTLTPRGDVADIGQFIQTYKQYDRKTLLGEMKNVQEKTHREKTYYTGGSKDGAMPAVVFLSDKIILRGTEAGIRRHLEGAPKAQDKALTGLLRELAEAPTLAVAVDMTQPGMRATLGPRFDDLRKEKPFLDGLRAVVLGVGIERTTTVRLRLGFVEPAQARQAETVVKEGVTIVREFFGTYARMTPAEVAAGGIPKLTRAMSHLAGELKSAEVGTKDGSVEFVSQIRIEGLETDFVGDLTGAALELMEAARQVRVAAERMRSSNSLKQLGYALHGHHDATGRLPAAAICDKNGKPLLSWRVAVLPYIEEDDLYTRFKLDEPWDSEHNKKLIPRMPKTYAGQGPVVRDYKKLHAEGYTFYQAFVGPGAMFESHSGKGFARGLRLLQDVTDGTSNTAMIAEAGEPVIWTKPEDLIYDPKKPLPKLGGLFPNGAQVGMADGSILLIPKDAPEKKIRALITRDGGEVVDLKDFRPAPRPVSPKP